MLASIRTLSKVIANVLAKSERDETEVEGIDDQKVEGGGGTRANEIEEAAAIEVKEVDETITEDGMRESG